MLKTSQANPTLISQKPRFLMVLTIFGPLAHIIYQMSSILIMEQHNNSMEKQNVKKELLLKDLPPHLQNKYKNSIIFEKEAKKKAKKFQFDMKKLKQRKAEKEKTIEEKLEQLKINPTEEKYLLNVFRQLSTKHGHQFFSSEDIGEVLRRMEIRMTSSQMDLMIWEFDENLNRKISEKEFINMYKKCTMDKSGAEPKNLFHLTQFMMYCRPGHYRITVEDTLELLYVRAKKEAELNKALDEKRLLENEIKVIFGEEEKTPEGVEKEIGFKEYLEKINKRAIEKRIQEIKKSRAQFKYSRSTRF